jgi:hypothetical protein
MGIKKRSDLDILLEELKEKGNLELNYTILNSEKILKCLQMAIIQERKICIENISLYRLESLVRAIKIKKSLLERLNVEPNNKDVISELEDKLNIYTEKAISVINEIVKTGDIKKYYNNFDLDIE